MLIYSSDYDYPVCYQHAVKYDVREFYDTPYDYSDDDYYGDVGSYYED